MASRCTRGQVSDALSPSELMHTPCGLSLRLCVWFWTEKKQKDWKWKLKGNLYCTCSKCSSWSDRRFLISVWSWNPLMRMRQWENLEPYFTENSNFSLWQLIAKSWWFWLTLPTVRFGHSTQNFLFLRTTVLQLLTECVSSLWFTNSSPLSSPTLAFGPT